MYINLCPVIKQNRSYIGINNIKECSRVRTFVLNVWNPNFNYIHFAKYNKILTIKKRKEKQQKPYI